MSHVFNKYKDIYYYTLIEPTDAERLTHSSSSTIRELASEIAKCCYDSVYARPFTKTAVSFCCDRSGFLAARLAPSSVIEIDLVDPSGARIINDGHSDLVHVLFSPNVVDDNTDCFVAIVVGVMSIEEHSDLIRPRKHGLYASRSVSVPLSAFNAVRTAGTPLPLPLPTEDTPTLDIVLEVEPSSPPRKRLVVLSPTNEEEDAFEKAMMDWIVTDYAIPQAMPRSETTLSTCLVIPGQHMPDAKHVDKRMFLTAAYKVCNFYMSIMSGKHIGRALNRMVSTTCTDGSSQVYQEFVLYLVCRVAALVADVDIKLQLMSAYTHVLHDMYSDSSALRVFDAPWNSIAKAGLSCVVTKDNAHVQLLQSISKGIDRILEETNRRNNEVPIRTVKGPWIAIIVNRL